jgi:hypothetical protein
LQKNRGILLASFVVTDKDELVTEEVTHIIENYSLTNNIVFVLEDVSNPDNKIITYNAVVPKGQKLNSRLFTMRVHRKKQTNTLYTINALNAAIAKQYDGKTGKDLKLDWENYRDSLLITTGKELKAYNVQVTKIFKIEEPPEEQ